MLMQHDPKDAPGGDYAALARQYPSLVLIIDAGFQVPPMATRP